MTENPNDGDEEKKSSKDNIESSDAITTDKNGKKRFRTEELSKSMNSGSSKNNSSEEKE